MTEKKSHKITVYSTPSCPFCNMAKDYFKKEGVKFTEHDVASDIKAREEMLHKSGQMGVPVIDIDGTIIVGFNKPAIEAALA